MESSYEFECPWEGSRTELNVSHRQCLLSAACSAREVATVIRNHFGVENKLHCTLDMVFVEDLSMVRNDNGPIDLSSLRKMAMNALRQEPLRL